MTDQVVLQEAETRRAELLDRALADGKGIEEALALAARAEAFITGAIAPMAILGTQPALPPPAPSDEPVVEVVRPRTDAGPRPGEPMQKLAATGPSSAGLRRTGKRRPWSAEDIAYLKQAWPAGVPIEEIAARLEGRNGASIRSKAFSLGLKRSPACRSVINRTIALERHGRERQSRDPSPKDSLGLDPAFAAVMEYIVAWIEERGEAVGRDDATGGYLFRGNNLTAHQLVAQANGVRRRLGEPLFALPDSDPPSAPGMGTAAGMVVEAAP